MRTTFGAVIVALAVTATGANAQISLGGGPSHALGSLGDATKTGYHVLLSAGLSVPLIPIALRVDGAWNQFPYVGADADARILSGTANAVLSLPSLGITPYVIGGLGVYNQRTEVPAGTQPAPDEETASSTDIGANVGAGIRIGLPGLSAFAEARLHNIFTDGDATRFVPLSIGLRF